MGRRRRPRDRAGDRPERPGDERIDWPDVQVSGTGPATATAPDSFANSGSIVNFVVQMHGGDVDEPTDVPLDSRAFVPVQRLPQNERLLPSSLLRSEYGVVPFIGREHELEDLRAWCDAEHELGLRLVTGPGGQGKTRLALNVIAWAEQCRWKSGRLRADCGPETLRELCSLPDHTLVVVDYAETRPHQLTALLAAAGERPAGCGRLRLLLLARSSGEWWTDIRVKAPDRPATLMHGAEHELRPLFGQADDRAPMFHEAVRKFAETGGYDREGVRPPDDLANDAYASALALHMAALAALLDREEPVEAADTFRDPAGRVLDHEQRYWQEAARAADLPDRRFATLRAAMTVVTCCGASSRDKATDLMGCVPELADEPRRLLRRYADWAHELHPGEGWLNPLQPDLLGERLVADTLIQQAELPTALAGADLDPGQMAHLWTVLARTAARFPAVQGLMSVLLTAGPDSLWLAGALIASSLPHPHLVQSALIATVEGVEDPAFLLGAVRVMPHSHRNCELKIRAVEHALHLYRRAPSRKPAVEAALHASLGDGLASAGRTEEAAEALRTAADLYRGLFAEDPAPYKAAYLGALGNLSTQLGSCGRHDEALGACDEALTAAERHGMEVGWFLKVQYHWRRSDRFRDEGKPDKARRALSQTVDVCRAAAESDVEAAAFLPTLLMNLANRWSDLQRHDEALTTIEESVGIQREGERLHPDPLRPNLPYALINYSQCLYASGRPQDGYAVILEAVDRLLRLTEHHSPRLPTLWAAVSLWAARLAQRDPADPAVRAEYERFLALREGAGWPTDGRLGMATAAVMMRYAAQLSQNGDPVAGARLANEAFALAPMNPGRRPRFYAAPPDHADP